MSEQRMIIWEESIKNNKIIHDKITFDVVSFDAINENWNQWACWKRMNFINNMMYCKVYDDQDWKS